jgi:hypothetical protein
MGPTVDRSFMRDLKNLDRRLDVKFNGQHFVVTYDRGHGEPVNIHRVKAEDGGFRQPDQREMVFLKQADLAQGRSMDSRLRELAYESYRMREKIKAKHRENIRDMTKDGKNQLAKAFIQSTNLSKGNATFRRIVPKTSKNAVMVIP